MCGLLESSCIAELYPKEFKLYDFHTHTFLSDGVLSPVELVRRAKVIGYRALAITDHVGPGNLEFVLNVLTKDCELASRCWDIKALPGVEITHVPKEDIDYLAREAKAMGAKVVNVHGETITEPVEYGTNLAAVSSDHVDILAHPGLIRPEEASIAAQNSVFFSPLVTGKSSNMRFMLAEMDHQNGVPFKTEKSGLEAVRIYVRVRGNPQCPHICAHSITSLP